MGNLAYKAETAPKRDLRWHLKWCFACYAVSFALCMLIVLVSLPFSGFAFVEFWFGPLGGIAMLAIAVAVSPFVYRRLR
jgi:hypothetical protein